MSRKPKVLRRKSAELLLQVILTRAAEDLDEAELTEQVMAGHAVTLAEEKAALGRQLVVAEMLVRGFPYREIATAIGLKSLQSVHAEVQKCIAIWREDMVNNIDQHVVTQLEKYNRYENEMWEAWERSKHLTQEGMVRQNIYLENPSSKGDPKFIEVALRVSEARAKLLGLNAPEALVVTRGYVDAPVEQRADRIASILHAVRARRAQQFDGGQSGAGLLPDAPSVVDLQALPSPRDQGQAAASGAISGSLSDGSASDE